MDPIGPMRSNYGLGSHYGPHYGPHSASEKLFQVAFVPYYAQRLSAACVLYGASAILKSLKRMAARRRSATGVA